MSDLCSCGNPAETSFSSGDGCAEVPTCYRCIVAGFSSLEVRTLPKKVKRSLAPTTRDAVMFTESARRKGYV